MVHSVPTPGCDNPNNLNTMAIIDTGANISLLNTNAPADGQMMPTANTVEVNPAKQSKANPNTTQKGGNEEIYQYAVQL